MVNMDKGVGRVGYGHVNGVGTMPTREWTTVPDFQNPTAIFPARANDPLGIQMMFLERKLRSHHGSAEP